MDEGNLFSFLFIQHAPRAGNGWKGGGKKFSIDFCFIIRNRDPNSQISSSDGGPKGRGGREKGKKKKFFLSSGKEIERRRNERRRKSVSKQGEKVAHKNAINCSSSLRIMRFFPLPLSHFQENKMRDMLAMQKQLEEEQAKEMVLAATAQNEKKRLLSDLAEQVS